VRNEREPPRRLADGAIVESQRSWLSANGLTRLVVGGGIAAFLFVCFRLAEVSISTLIAGLPRLANWAARAWPPYTGDFDAFLLRAAETVAIATVGTLIATILAFPVSILIARNITPSVFIATPVRWLANACRGIDTVVFAILFVAAVGLGPFAGVLGMVVHSVGVIAKLNAEAIETTPPAPLEAAEMAGATRTRLVTYALLPSVLPNLASVSLYVWEANVRTSTILGIVGAGGIGIEIKAAIDLLDFQKLLTLSCIVLVMVTVIDQFSSWLRRRLV
jgi:phosphonate transport system permease protein